MDIHKIIGENLHALRTKQNLSLGQLAELCGISKMVLSQIERGETNPTINTLWKIANGLQVPYTRLMEPQTMEPIVVRKGDGEMQENEAGNYHVFPYFLTSPTRDFELFRMELAPESENTSIGHRTGSEEYLVVLAGELEIETGGQCYILHSGDAITFQAERPHTYRNRKKCLVETLIINYYR